jgi:hypothetical protein
MRQPNCQYLEQTLTADENNGITVWHCTQYDITWRSYLVIDDMTATSQFDNVLGKNPDCFSDCKTCQYNLNK